MSDGVHPLSRTAGQALEQPSHALHGAVLVPPVLAWDGQRYAGSTLVSVTLDAARAMPGVAAVVREQHFAGVVAVSALHARQALDALAPVWQSSGRASRAIAPAVTDADYTWQVMPTTGEGAVTAWCVPGRVAVWLPAGHPDAPALIRQELSALLALPEGRVELHERDGGEGHAPAAMRLVDAAASAALLSRAAGRPVQVALRAVASTRVRLHAVSDAPASAGAAQPGPEGMDGTRVGVPLASSAPRATPGAGGGAPAASSTHTPASALARQWQTDGVWAVRPSLARLLTLPHAAGPVAGARVLPADAVSGTSGVHLLSDAGPQDLDAAQVFAQESQWCDAAVAAGNDPIAARLAALQGKARALATQVVQQAPWASAGAEDRRLPDGRLRGVGLATAHLAHHDDDGQPGTVWSAWVAEVAVHPQTGHIDVTRVVAGHDSERLQPAQAAPVHGQIVHDEPWLMQGAQRLLGTDTAFDDWRAARPTPLHDAARSVAPHAPDHAVVNQGRLALDGVLTLPAAAAIANAIHDATGVRLREAPFDVAQLRRALGQGDSEAVPPGLRRAWRWATAGAAGLAGLAVMAWPAKPAIPLTAGPDVSLYSDQAIERGRLVAAAGDCVACHTAPGGKPNAGGFALETPFGTIYSTNITPDAETGIGRWSYAAFERAMRQGIHQDGRQLYPAFPYTAFAKLSDADIQSLYAYLMTQPAVSAKAPETRLAFPYSLRPAIAGWNLLFHDATPFSPDPGRSIAWNRGAYLVEGAGHCAACHSPRNSLGAEKKGLHYLAGGEAEGWQAPALNVLGTGALPWTRDELFQYLRTGHASRHGVAAGPMAPVIQGLAELPDSDIHAMVTYLTALPGQAPQVLPGDAESPASRTGPVTSAPPAAHVVPQPVAPTSASRMSSESSSLANPQPREARVFATHANGERIYQNACAVCHEAGSGPTLFGVKPMLGFNTNLHADTPDNLLQVILHGIQNPADDALGYMPGFADSLDDTQLTDLAGYLRARFAPGSPAWSDLPTAVRAARPVLHDPVP
ncbi:c-type cytochrome [Achromobacter sp. GG226]|uniref:c-type cytochrome n=1 Tax=Verticiella alkaliphila TaxID=2779529 RepID=UPI001C0D5FDD|nr:c-type cytochrome [Verticiella sp. GG226]MBU4612036.1 c-type cytochrome [Verticiella sp. GG226]